MIYYLITAILFAILVLLFVLSRREQVVRVFQAQLSDDDRRRAMVQLAQQMRTTVSVGNTPRVHQPLRHMRRGYRAVCRKVKEHIPLYEHEKWLYENYRSVVFAIRVSDYRGFGALPHQGGRARILALARLICGSTRCKLSQQVLQDCLTEFQRNTPLRYAELTQLGAALRLALVEQIAQIADMCQRDARMRQAALSDKQPDPRYVSDDAYLYYYLHTGKPIAKSAWYRNSDLNPDRLDANYAHALVDACSWIGNAVTSFHALEGMLGAEFLLSVSESDRLLRSDEIYRNMDVCSRHVYHAAIAKLARMFRVSERAVVDTTMRIAARERVDFGCVLFDYRYAIRAELSGKYIRTLSRPTHVSDQRLFIAAVVLLDIAITVLCVLIARPLWARILVGLCVPIGAWLPCQSILTRLGGMFLPDRATPRMSYSDLPDQGATAVAVSAYLVDAEHAKQAVERLFALRAVNAGKNITFCLLADLPSATSETVDADQPILDVLRSVPIEEDICLCVRKRTYDGKKYCGHERKRGAIQTLCGAILSGDWQGFSYVSKPIGHAEFLLMLDEDSRLPVGGARQAANTLLHPLNAKYDLLTFDNRYSLASVTTRYAWQFVENGGIESYCNYSDFFYRLCGHSVFCGKGICRIRPFYAKLSDTIPDNRVLSHDILEGAMLGAGSVSAAVYEDCPKSFLSDVERRNRWTRGDILLAGFMRKPYCTQPIYGYVILSNLIATLRPIGALLLWLGLLITGNLALLFAAAVVSMLIPLLEIGFLLLSPGKTIRPRYQFAKLTMIVIKTVVQVVMLPFWAVNNLLLWLKTLVKLAFGRDKLLEWKTFYASQRSKGYTAHAAMLLPSILAVVVLAGVFYTSIPLLVYVGTFVIVSNYLYRLGKSVRTRKTCKSAYTEDFQRLAVDTGRYFAAAQSQTLIADNLQIEPAQGYSTTTSPTNMGFWLISAVCRFRLGQISSEDAVQELTHVLDATDGLERWRGHMYNWYDCRSKEPVVPFVSSVDSGNWCACLIVARQFCIEQGQNHLAQRIRSQLQSVQWDALYDPVRAQLHIGYDTQTQSLQGHYDLIASEARLTSYIAACAMRDPECWFGSARRMSGRLGNIPMSWSGTAFEYLMPDLFLKSVQGSMMTLGVQRAVRLMKRRKCCGLWGISESGYYAFDADMKYQYHAFGLSELALRSHPDRCVIAPYAGILALRHQPTSVWKNMQKIVARGGWGRYGLYEAIDYTQGKQIVRSHMTHHQGMILCALTNYLCDDAIVRYFMQDESMAGGSLLLEEKPLLGSYPRTMQTDFSYSDTRGMTWSKEGDPLSDPCGVQALTNGNYSIVIDDCGCGCSSFAGKSMFRYRHGADEDCGAFVYCAEDGQLFGPTFAPIRQDPESFRVTHGTDASEFVNTKHNCSMRVYVPQSLHGEVRALQLDNESNTERVVKVGFYAPLCLTTVEEDVAHPAFSDLFVETYYDTSCDAWIARRKSRNNSTPVYAALAVSGMEWKGCGSIADFVGRGHGLQDPIAMTTEFRPQEKTVGNPCFGCVGELHIPPHQSAQVVFTIVYDTDLQSLRRQLERTRMQDFESYAYQTTTLPLLSYMRKYLDTPTCVDTAYQIFRTIRHRRYGWQQCYSMTEYADCALPLGLRKERPFLLLDSDADDVTVHDMLRSVVYANLAGLQADLVVLCREQDNYHMEVAQRIARVSGIRDWNTLPFVYTVDDKSLTHADHKMLQTFVLRILQDDPIRIPCHDRVTVHRDWYAVPRVKLLDSGYGGLDENGAYHVTQMPPRCYANVVSGPKGGFVITENGGGFDFGENSQSEKWTKWSNQPVLDPPTEMLCIADRRGVIRINRLVPEGSVTHANGYTCFDGGADGCNWHATKCVIRDGGVHVWQVQLINTTDTELSRDVILQLRAQLGASVLTTLLYDTKVTDDMLCITDAYSGKKLYLRSMQNGYAPVHAYCLHGKEGNIPSRVDCVTAIASEQPAHAWVCNTQVPPKQNVTLYFAIGTDVDVISGLHTQDMASEMQTGRNPPQCVNPFTLHSGDPYLDSLFNHRLMYQVVACRMQARCGFYQAGGAIGFRDQLQDSLAVLYSDPERVRRHILDCAQHQYIEGDVMHWWHPPRFGVRTRISDDKLFLPYVTARYMRNTGDTSILDERVPYLIGAPLEAGQEARLEHGQLSDGEESLYRHILRAIDNALVYGPNGLLCIGSGDWNDALNDIGQRGKGESVWLTMFAVHTLECMLPWFNDADRSKYLQVIARLRDAAASQFRNNRFLRAYTDDGEVLGDENSRVCKLDLLCQSWAVLADVGTKEQQSAALHTARMLADTDHGVIRLLDPPFDESWYCGYISAYPHGVRENGGQYTHAAVWYLSACAKAGQDEFANTLLQALNPLRLCADPKRAKTFGGEPYVMPADVWSAPAAYGNMGWSWYTGSASWMYQTILRDMLGVDIENRCLVFSRPHLKNWEDMRLDYRYNGSVYHISFRRGASDDILLDGVRHTGSMSVGIRAGLGEVSVCVEFAD